MDVGDDRRYNDSKGSEEADSQRSPHIRFAEPRNIRSVCLEEEWILVLVPFIPVAFLSLKCVVYVQV
jgi:hypothetical protein